MLVPYLPPSFSRSVINDRCFIFCELPYLMQVVAILKFHGFLTNDNRSETARGGVTVNHEESRLLTSSPSFREGRMSKRQVMGDGIFDQHGIVIDVHFLHHTGFVGADCLVADAQLNSNDLDFFARG